MADSSPMILQKIDAGLLSSVPKPRPDAVFVLSYSGGGLRTFDRTPFMSERVGSKYCYIVDTSARHTSGSLRIPAMGDVYFFQLGYDSTWQVTDPEVVVRQNISDGDAVVDGFLRDALWRIGRSYSPSAVHGAEDEARRQLRPPLDPGGGLTVTWLSIRLALDAYQSEAALEVDADAHTGRLTRTRVQRLRELLDGDEAFLLLHLTQHPDDTRTVLEMITATRERNEQVRLGLLERMLEKGFIQDADIGPLRESILGASGPVILPPRPPAPSVLPPAIQVIQPVGTDSDTSDTGYEDEVGTSAQHNTPGNVKDWKPVRKPTRGQK